MRVEQLIILVCSLCLVSFNGNSQGKRETQKIRRYGGELSQPKEAAISLDSANIFSLFNDKNIDILKRYISGNSRWEIRKEKKFKAVGKDYVPHEVVYAVRKESRNGIFETTLNGYYSNFSGDNDIYQTRVLISFGQQYGHGRDTTHITYVPENSLEIETIIEAEHSGTPGNSSYLIIDGTSINIEIYEQSKVLKRKYTINAIRELNEELLMVLNNLESINETGLSPSREYYSSMPDSNYFDIKDGMQPGIYLIKAGIATTEKGIVYIKAFNSETNERLSENRVTPKTTRELGWANNGQTIFPYESEIVIYEGDWSHKYKARFEIWFRSEDGNEIKLAEKERVINGWQR